MKKSDFNNEHFLRRSVVFALTCIFVCILVLGSVFAAGQNRPRNASVQSQPAQTPKPAQQGAPSPTPTPTRKQTSGAPTLGDAPPVPKLKPTPTPTPPETLDPESILK